MATEESTSAPDPDTVQETGRRRGLSLITMGVALLVAGGIGLAIGYFVFDDSSGPADEWSAEVATAHVEYACDITERISETHATQEDLGGLGEDPWIYESIAVGSLISAASHEPQYEHLSDLGTDAQAAAVRIDFDGWTEFVDSFLDECS